MAFGSNALTAKTKAKFSKYLTKGDYQNLLAKEQLSEVVNYLRNNTNYSEYLNSVSDDNIHRAELEDLLRNSIFQRFSQLLRFADKKTLGFYHYQVILFEIKLVTSYFQSLGTIPIEKQDKLPVFYLARYSKVNFKALASASDYQMFVDGLVDTPYQTIFLRYRPQNNERVNYTNIEIALNKYYYQELNRLIQKHFKGRHKRAVNELIYTHIELENLTRIYRLKKYFNAEPQAIKAIISPYYKKIKAKQLNHMIDNLDATQFLSEIKTTKYISDFGEDSVISIENYMKQVMYNVSKHYLNFSNNAAVVLVSYLELIEIEIENIIEIVEGKRYNIESEQLTKLLIG